MRPFQVVDSKTKKRMMQPFQDKMLAKAGRKYLNMWKLRDGRVVSYKDMSLDPERKDAVEIMRYEVKRTADHWKGVSV